MNLASIAETKADVVRDYQSNSQAVFACPAMTNDRATQITSLLKSEFSPDYLLVKDQSHLHAGHAGAKDGRGHFDVTIVADAFSGCGRLQAHRLVYAALGDLMHTDIHALSIKASANNDD